VERGVAGVPGVSVLDLDDVRDWATPALAARQAEAVRVEEIVDEEVTRYLEDAAGRQAAPLVAALHERAELIRAAELERFGGRLGALDDRERDAVDALTRAIVAKLLHDPSVRLRQGAGTPRGERNAGALRDLFDLP
jgi:glutamyl-tRNA reductase